MNAEARVMEHFPAPLDRAASDALAARLCAEIAERGYSRARSGNGAANAP